MKHSVLRIGAAKCGSSSIQNAIKDPAMGVSNLMRSVILKPKMIDLLDSDHPEAAAVDGMNQIIKSRKSRWSDKPLVLSHEVLFTSAQALGHLSAIARSHADRVTAVAYVRRQSDFLVSAYGQWLFRFPERSAETARTLQENGLDPTLFWGVERHLIAVILSTAEPGQPPRRHLHIDWSSSVPERREILAAHRATLSVGILPRAGYGPPLIEDFLTRIDLDPRASKPQGQVQTADFAPAMTEAVLNAIEVGYAMPGRHEYNDVFENCGVAARGAQAERAYGVRQSQTSDPSCR